MAQTEQSEVNPFSPGVVHVVVMGVAGCGKSAIGRLIADTLNVQFIEGDEFHPPGNIRKMQQGIALDDADRSGWLQLLGQQLAGAPEGAVLTCSALKAAYRDRLRREVTGLRFVHLAISQTESLRRVSARPGHFYPPSLVASQFNDLEDPAAERGVLTLRGDEAVKALVSRAVAWLAAGGALSGGPAGQ